MNTQEREREGGEGERGGGATQYSMSLTELGCDDVQCIEVTRYYSVSRFRISEIRMVIVR